MLVVVESYVYLKSTYQAIFRVPINNIIKGCHGISYPRSPMTIIYHMVSHVQGAARIYLIQVVFV